MKYTFTALLSLCIATYSLGQGFEAYAIGGVTLSQIEGDKLKGYNNVGFTVGGASNFLLKNDFAFQQEIVYYQRGSKATDDELNADIFTNKDLRYIDFAVLLNKEVKERWVLQAGAGAGKLIGLKTDDPNDKLTYYNIDIFALAGGGYYITDDVMVNLRLQFSLRSAEKVIPFFHNNSLALTLRWRFIGSSMLNK